LKKNPPASVSGPIKGKTSVAKRKGITLKKKRKKVRYLRLDQGKELLPYPIGVVSRGGNETRKGSFILREVRFSIF